MQQPKHGTGDQPATPEPSLGLENLCQSEPYSGAWPGAKMVIDAPLGPQPSNARLFPGPFAGVSEGHRAPAPVTIALLQVKQAPKWLTIHWLFQVISLAPLAALF